jgi:hypothetical protein
MKIQFLKTVGATAFPLLVVSCKMEVIDQNYPDIQPGKIWVRSAAGAYGYIGASKYYILDELGGPVIDGPCICIPEHIVYLSYLDGLIGAGPETATVENRIIGYAKNACKERADELGMDEDSDNCEQIVQAATPYVLDDCEAVHTGSYCEGLPGTYETGDGETAETGDGETAEPLSPLEDPSSHVSCPSTTLCEVSEELFEYARDNPGELMYTGATVEEVSLTGGGSGFEFIDVPSGCVADELLFQVDDIITKINGYLVGNTANWPTIVASLATADTATVTYLRSSAEYTLTLTVDD